MAVRCIDGVRICGIASCVPASRRVISAELFADRIMAKRFSSVTGVRESRAAYMQGLVSSDLCYEAARTLMARLGWSGGDVDTMIFVSQSRDYPIPMTACLLQERLGISQSCMAFDIPSGCSGFVQGLAAVASLLVGAQGKRGLLFVGEVNKADGCGLDSGTNLLFGDAGGVCAVERRQGASPMVFDFGTDGSGYKYLYTPAGGFRHPIRREDFDYVEGHDGIRRRPIDCIIDGPKIFEFAVDKVPASVSHLLEGIGVSVDDVDGFVFHQANQLINETIRKKLKVPSEKHPYSIDLFGNTSSASIPLTITTNLSSQLETGPSKLVLCGFGVGLSWASAYVETDGICCPGLVEI